MKRNNELIDGIEISTWKEIERIAKTYPKPIRFSDGLNSKIALLKFYLEPLLPNGKPPIESSCVNPFHFKTLPLASLRNQPPPVHDKAPMYPGKLGQTSSTRLCNW
jgi:hypothetical protein